MLRLTGEAIARKLGNALVAPIVPIEAGNPEKKDISWGNLYFTEETFKGVLRDMATSLKSQGFKNIIMMGDSGGDIAGLKAVAQELDAKWSGTARAYHIPEYYNWKPTRVFRAAPRSDSSRRRAVSWNILIPTASTMTTVSPHCRWPTI